MPRQGWVQGAGRGHSGAGKWVPPGGGSGFPGSILGAELHAQGLGAGFCARPTGTLTSHQGGTSLQGWRGNSDPRISEVLRLTAPGARWARRQYGIYHGALFCMHVWGSTGMGAESKGSPWLQSWALLLGAPVHLAASELWLCTLRWVPFLSVYSDATRLLSLEACLPSCTMYTPCWAYSESIAQTNLHHPFKILN